MDKNETLKQVVWATVHDSKEQPPDSPMFTVGLQQQQ